MYAAFVLQLCILRLFILKTEGQTIYKKKIIAKLQNSNQNCLSWVSLIGL